MSDERYRVSGTATTVDTENGAREDANHDSATRSHPVGTSVGAATGGTVGAVIGGGGPVSATVGAKVGGLATAATASHGTVSSSGSESTRGYSHEDYRPAYWYGWEAAQKYPGRRWAEVASEMERGWDQAKGVSRLPWNEAEPAVHEAWNRARPHQVGPNTSRAVPLEQLHDPETGRLDAGRVADYLSLPLKQFSEALGRNYSTVHRTPTAPALQETLRSIKRSLMILEKSLGNRASVLAWLNSPHHDLGGRTPMQILLEGRAQTIEDMLEAALEGIPS